MSTNRMLLLPLVPVYRLGLALRAWRLRSGQEQVRRLRWPVISIGNLSVGGAGKTPLTIALARALTARGLRVDVLSRGYGRRSTLPLAVDPAGTAEEFGDEPLVIAREAGVPVFVAAERYEAGLLAEAEDTFGTHLLDDGFQHRQLHRDVNLLLLNQADWQGSLLPAGSLREPRSAIGRADVLVIPADEPELEAMLRARGHAQPVWRMRRRMEPPAAAGPVVAFCGIARPEQFFAGLQAAGMQVASRVAFRDHHRYIAHDVDCLRDAARSVHASAFVTTEKDRARLGPMIAGLTDAAPLHTAGLRVELEDENATLDWMLARIG
jgi:tetraacyldisaccharide 4'-kinase